MEERFDVWSRVYAEPKFKQLEDRITRLEKDSHDMLHDIQEIQDVMKEPSKPTEDTVDCFKTKCSECTADFECKPEKAECEHCGCSYCNKFSYPLNRDHMPCDICSIRISRKIAEEYVNFKGESFSRRNVKPVHDIVKAIKQALKG